MLLVLPSTDVHALATLRKPGRVARGPVLPLPVLRIRFPVRPDRHTRAGPVPGRHSEPNSKVTLRYPPGDDRQRRPERNSTRSIHPRTRDRATYATGDARVARTWHMGPGLVDVVRIGEVQCPAPLRPWTTWSWSLCQRCSCGSLTLEVGNRHPHLRPGGRARPGKVPQLRSTATRSAGPHCIHGSPAASRSSGRPAPA